MSTYSNSPSASSLFVFYTVFFAIGTGLVIVSVFLPLIDQAALISQNRYISWKQQEHSREMQKLQDKEREALEPIDKKISEATVNEKRETLRTQRRTIQEDHQKKRDKLREDWDKRREELNAELDAARYHVVQRFYVYRWIMFAGYLVLAFGAIGYLHPSQGVAQRVVGAVILCIQVAFVFVMFTAAGSVITSVWNFSAFGP